MSNPLPNRRAVITSTGAILATGGAGLLAPATAGSLAPTPSMRGGSNNFRPGAPFVERIGGGGFWMSGTVRRAGDGAPLSGIRIQIWAHTTEGHERDPNSHGATLTRVIWAFALAMGLGVAIGLAMGRSPRLNRWLAAFWEVVLTLVILLIIWRLYEGTLSHMKRGGTTVFLQFPLWWPYLASLIAGIVACITAIYCVFCRCAEAMQGRVILPQEHPEH